MNPFQKFFVKGYRIAAVAILSFVLFAAGSYFLTMGVFSVNSSWSAPVIISKTNARIMAISSEVFRAQQAIDALTVEANLLKSESTHLSAQEATLIDLVGRYEKALTAQQNMDDRLSGRLNNLTADKRAVDRKAAQVVAANAALEQSIEKELKAGLITAEAAARARAQVFSAQAQLNAGLLGTASLEHQVSELNGSLATMKGAAESPKALESLARVTVLKRELIEVQLKLKKNEMELVNKEREAKTLRSFLATLENSPYYQVAMGADAEHTFAFVPYDNEGSAKVGAPVYSCFAKILFCSKVGTIKSVSKEEEKVRHPIFHRDVRGFLVDMDLEDGKAAKDKVLFFGSAPLFL